MNSKEENKIKFLEIYKNIKRQGADELLAWIIRSDFFIAPASTMFHGNYNGALCEHSINVYNLFREKNKRYDLGLNEESIAIMGLLHDLCKVNYYKPTTRNKKIDGQWKAIPWYDVDDSFAIGHGEKSVIMIQQFMKLSGEEMIGIRWHMGGYESKENYRTLSTAWAKYKSGSCLHTADLEASNLLEEHIDYEHPQIKMNV